MPLAEKQQEVIFGGGYIALSRRLGISCNVPLELDDVSTMAVGFPSYPDALEKYFPFTDCLSTSSTVCNKPIELSSTASSQRGVRGRIMLRLWSEITRCRSLCSAPTTVAKIWSRGDAMSSSASMISKKMVDSDFCWENRGWRFYPEELAKSPSPKTM